MERPGALPEALGGLLGRGLVDVGDRDLVAAGEEAGGESVSEPAARSGDESGWHLCSICAALWAIRFSGRDSALNYRILRWRKYASTFARVPRALPLNLLPLEKGRDRGTQLLGRIVA